MSVQTFTKVAQDGAMTVWRFDAASLLAFDNVASIGAGVANTTVQARLPIPQRCMIPKVTVDYSAIADTTGDHKFNIVVGTGSYTQGTVVPQNNARVTGPLASAIPGGQTPPSVAVAGDALFSADQALTAAADTPTTFLTATPDGLIPQNALLTLRVVTPATTGSISNLKITLVTFALAPYNGNSPQYPQQNWPLPSAVDGSSSSFNGGW